MNNDNPWNAIIKLTRKQRSRKNGTTTLTYVPFQAFADDTRTVKVLIKQTDGIIEILELAEYENGEVIAHLNTLRHSLVIQHIGNYFEKKVLLPVAA